MKIRVRQTTAYCYSRTVYLEPHAVRLLPQSDPSQTVVSCDLSIAPDPAKLTWAIDAEGNLAANIWFEDRTQELRLTTEFEVETLRKNTFDFLWLEGSDRLGFVYRERAALERFLAVEGSPLDLTKQSLVDSGGRTPEFLAALNRAIYQSIRVVIREDGDAHPPEETLGRGEGACRDMAWLFVLCCRQAGLAARFVSGYQVGDPDMEDRYLHAWAEVYLPGGGWRGFDPTLGLAVADQHVRVAAAATPVGAAPLAGSFRGSGATARMETVLSLTASVS